MRRKPKEGLHYTLTFSLFGGGVSGSSATSPFANERLMVSFVLLSAFLVGAKVELSL